MRAAALFALTLVSALTSHAQTAKPEAAERVAWPTLHCYAGTCQKMDGVGYLFAKPGQDKVVMISHGSQGIDKRMFEYVDSLQEAGFAAFVMDHWGPRGIGVTHEDYAAASLKGGNEYNIAVDGLTAAAWLRARGFRRVGSIGESQGGSAAISMQQKYLHVSVDRTMKRLYGSFELKPLDASVGLYGYCGYRNTKRDAYVDTPLLFVTGAEDDNTPSRYCERHVGWMNERGGRARIVVLPDEGHSFDAPYRRTRSLGPHYGKCDVLYDGQETTEFNSRQTLPGEQVLAMLAKCVSRGYHTGSWKDRFVGVKHWIAFFREQL